MPTSMRAQVTTHHGGLDALDLRDVVVPTPDSHEVVVQVTAAGCNNTDLWTREGSYGTDVLGGWLGPVDFPRIQGADVVGRVTSVGELVDPSLIGTRVLVDPALYATSDPESLVVDVLGSERDGGFAEFVVVAADCVHDMTDSPLADQQLAALPIAYGTALGMLERGGVGRGQTVLVTGASGGVGLPAVQLASTRGARVVAVCSGSKSAAVLEAGASTTVDRQQGSVYEHAMAAAPEGYDAVIDVVAGPLVGPGLGLMRPGGRWVVAGALDGWAVDLDVRRLYLANISLVGSTMHTRRVFGLLGDLARRGDVHPVVAATFPLADLAEAQQALARREHVGKLIIVP